MENESLKLEIGKHISASQKRRGDGHDSGDFNHFNETSVDGEGRVTGLLGSLEVPFLVNHEVQAREDRMTTYFRNKTSELKAEKEELKSKTEHYVKEVRFFKGAGKFCPVNSTLIRMNTVWTEINTYIHVSVGMRISRSFPIGVGRDRMYEII